MRKQLNKLQSIVYFVIVSLSIIDAKAKVSFGQEGIQLRQKTQVFCTIERTATGARIAIFGDVLDASLTHPHFSIGKQFSANRYGCRGDRLDNTPWYDWDCPSDGVDGFNVPLPPGSMDGVLEIGVDFNVKSGQWVSCNDPKR